MKKILFCSLLLVSFIYIGCNNNDNSAAIDTEEIDTIEEDSADVGKTANKGKDYLEQGDIEKAIELFNEALKIDNNVDWVHGDLGRAKQEKNDFEGAIECYTKAIELNGKRSIYYSWRADAYGLLGKEDLAQEDRKIAEELHSKGLD